MDGAQYSRVVATVGLLIVVIACLISWLYVRQPQTGDLARIAGYVEHQYGANNPLTRLGWSEQSFSWMDTEALSVQGYGDVLIFGDSFTGTGQRFNWANELARITGLDVHATSVRSIRSVILSDRFRQNPPGLVILESVERDVIEYLATADRKLAPRDEIVEAVDPLDMHTTPVTGVEATMPVKTFASFEQRISTTLDYIGKQAWQLFDVIPHALLSFRRKKEAPAIFSAKKTDQFLYLPEDLQSLEVSEAQFAEALSGYHKLRAAISGAGKTHFSLLIVPNRLSVYLPYLDTDGLPADQMISTTLSRLTNSFNPIPMFRQQIESGTLDIYWPMDTHLSAVGAKLLANGYVNWLQGQRILSPDQPGKSKVKNEL